MVEEEEGRQGALAGALDAGDKGGDRGAQPGHLLGTGRGSVRLPRKKYPHDSMEADRPPTSPQPATSTQAASLRPYCAQGRARGETQGAGGRRPHPTRCCFPSGRLSLASPRDPSPATAGFSCVLSKKQNKKQSPAPESLSPAPQESSECFWFVKRSLVRND